jgi:DNA-3-methyladenine glycosylase I
MRIYHDSEWGVPSRDERHLFEMLTLEGAQAGLSWATILNKRDGYRRLFEGFDVDAVAAFSDADVERLLADPGIVRNRSKVTSTVNNAVAIQALANRGSSLSEFLWGFVDGKPIQGRYERLEDLPAKTEVSTAMSKALLKAGFRFVGPTVCYALMQAVGMVNDHETSCFRHAECASLG